MIFKIKIIIGLCVAILLGLALYVTNVQIISPDTFLYKSTIESLNQENQEEIDTSVVKFDCDTKDVKKFSCYEDYYKTLLKDFGVASAFIDLKKRIISDDYIKEKCHPLVHVLGNVAVEKYPTVTEAYKYGDGFCASGYYHGVLEGVIRKIDKGDLAKQMNNICEDIDGNKSDYFSCVHGLGHGAMAYSNNELFDALVLCDELDDDWKKISCYSGVFMENVIVDQKDHFTKYLKPDDLLYPCNAVDRKYMKACYEMQSSYILKIKGDFGKVFEECEKADDGFRNSCYESIGRDASAHSIEYSEDITSATKDICYLGKSFWERNMCVFGAIKYFIYHYESPDQAIQLCNSLEMYLQSVCSSIAKVYYRQNF